MSLQFAMPGTTYGQDNSVTQSATEGPASVQYQDKVERRAYVRARAVVDGIEKSESDFYRIKPQRMCD